MLSVGVGGREFPLATAVFFLAADGGVALIARALLRSQLLHRGRFPADIVIRNSYFRSG